MDNYAIADQFSLLSKLMDIHGENSFKAKSYSIAAFNIEKLPVQLEDLPRPNIFSLQGIGDAIGKKIIEILESGKINLLEELIEKTPQGILEMMQIKGIGPKKISTIWKEMGIENIGELLYACHENRLMRYKGFGEKTQTNVMEAIDFFQRQQGNFLFAQVDSLALDLEKQLQKLFKSATVTGGYKRQSETLDQLEYVIAADSKTILSSLEKHEEFELLEHDNAVLQYKYDRGIKVKLFASEKDRVIEKIFNTSGSEEFLTAFAGKYPDPGFGKAKSEEDLFQNLGLQFIPAYLREFPEILEHAKNRSIPEVIQPSDVKGLIHSHSNWSDGAYTLEKMVEGCIKKSFEYLVISDHSKAAFYANGLSEDRIKEQHELIDKLNDHYKPFKIFKSIESDILNDGSLDYPDKVLSSFDLVIGSVHSNLKMTEEKAMKRLLAAIENPYLRILGHMTGRLLLSRNGFPVDHIKLIDACAANNVVIELNAHPKRLDMRWQWIPYALEKGVLISIDPDAHSIEEFDNVKYGVLVAQKAMVTARNNLSSFSLEEFEGWLKSKRLEL